MDQYVFLAIMKVTPKTAEKTILISFQLLKEEKYNGLNINYI
jgi:hypothetical protein